MKKLIDRNIERICDLDKLVDKKEIHKYGRAHHINILTLNKTGLKNLFKIISLANTTYLYKTPRILRSEIEKHREGLLIGSGCYESEIFTEARSKGDEELTNLIKFYDYVEVQPIDCYDHLIQTGDFGTKVEVAANIEKIVRENFDVLWEKQYKLIIKDSYGNLEMNDWWKELEYFVENVVFQQENIKTISSCITFIKNNIKSTKYYRNSYYEQFLNDLNKSIESTLDFKSQYVKKYFTSSIERFTYYFNYDEEYRILNFTKYFDSFFSLFRSYKKFNFSLPGEILTLKNTIDSKHD